MMSNIDPKELETKRLKMLVEIWDKTPYLKNIPQDEKILVASILDRKAIELSTTSGEINPEEEYQKIVNDFLKKS